MADFFPQGSPRASATADQLRLYDQMMFDWLGTFSHPSVRSGNSVVRVFATPDRAFAEVRLILQRDKKDPIKTIPYPWISIYRGAPFLDRTRWERGRIKLGYTTGLGTIGYADWPMPYDLPYQIDWWARNRTTQNYINEWLMVQFDTNEFFQSVDFTGVNPNYGAKIIPIQYEAFRDTGEYDPGDPEDRALRYTLDVKVRAWIFRPVQESAKTILPPPDGGGIHFQINDDMTERTDVIGTGTGSAFTFSGVLSHAPVDPACVRIYVDSTQVGADDRLGVLSATGFTGSTLSSGYVNYSNGQIGVTFSSAPDSGKQVKAVYLNSHLESLDVL